MYEVVYMKADYEPWWMFDGWEETIVSRQSFSVKQEAEQYLEELVVKFRESYKKERKKDLYFYAFWSNEEQCYCDSCDDDLQLFHGLLMLYKGAKIV